MRIRSLQTRFILAGCLVAMITVASGAWSAWTFVRLSRVVDRTLRDGRATIELAAALAGSLEREDDAVLLALSGDAGPARLALLEERRRGDEGFTRLRTRLIEDEDDGASVLAELRGSMDAYRDAASNLIQNSDRPDSLKLYHERVNPILRKAVQACDAIRERHFASIQLAGVRARDEARAATRIVVAASLGALLLAAVVGVWLARSVVRPILALSRSVEALRLGDFEQSVVPISEDELGLLADGFNRMAETLVEYRRSSLGDLLAAKMTLESTLNALPDAVFVIAPDGSVAALNPPARAILGATQHSEAQHVNDLSILARHRDLVNSALAGRTRFASRADFSGVIRARLDGEPRKFLLTAVPIPGFAPRSTGAVVVLDDVTEFALLDELRSELVAVASHELKTPLTTIQMNLMLLGEGADAFTERQREMLETALLGCEELGTTIEELLDVTRIEAGQLRLDLAPVDAHTVVESAFRLLRSRFDDAEIRLEFRPEPGPAIVLADATRLRNVLTNLLSNALKYSPRGGIVRVEVSSRHNAGPDDPPTLQFAVTDQGPGVPEPFRERVFEKFFRVEHHLDRDRKDVRGTGIGLYLCREIVEAHDGSIWCAPGEAGVGTIFAFRLKSNV
jgi:NtrC-family two-component system sensor histidine kinase KinB